MIDESTVIHTSTIKEYIFGLMFHIARSAKECGMTVDEILEKAIPLARERYAKDIEFDKIMAKCDARIAEISADIKTLEEIPTKGEEMQ